ncbi:MAG TPA: ABC transporter substrate-binding protein [Kofleriaceae bacterium]|nr:ABC transporter substrate-binding protein [Kofleriaceae bacterium]
MSRVHLITALIALAACSRARRTPDNKIVVVIDSVMTSADSRFAISNNDSKLARLVGSGLTAVDTQSLEPRLDLASALEPAEAMVPVPIRVPVPTKLGDRVVVLPWITVAALPFPAWDITLRADAKFSDGAPVLAADVAYTYRSVLDPKGGSLHHKGFVERYWSVTPTGARTLRMVLKTPLATLRSDLDFAIVSATTGLGSGPYALRELDTQHALLVANPHYYGPRPKIEKLEFKFVRDAAARLLMLVGGSADLLQNGVRLDLVDEIKTRPRVHLDSAPSVLLTFLMMNNDDPLLKDRRVREAIALAIDRGAVVQAKFGGRAQLATGLLAPQHWAYAKELAIRTRDLARAKQLLDEAGYRDPDGDGPRPRMALTYKTSSDAFRMSIARLLAAQLADVGIEVEVRAFEFATFFADVKKGIYQLASMQTAEITEPDYYHFYFHSTRVPDKLNPDGGNRWRYRNPELDRIVDAGRREIDRTKRIALYHEAQRIVYRDLPIIPLWHEDNVVLTNVELSGYALTPNARYIGLVNVTKAAR